jgi:hypothetical protein
MSTEKTSLTKINLEDNGEEKIVLDEENLTPIIMDLSIEISSRITAINMFYHKYGHEIIETLNKLTNLYETYGTKLLRHYLYSIAVDTVIDPLLQSLCARALYSYNNRDELAFDSIAKIYPKLGTNIGTPYRIEFAKMLMYSEKHKENAKNYFCQIIDDNNLNCDFRYKTIVDLEKMEGDMTWYICHALLIFIVNKINKPNFRIISGQYLLCKCVLDEEKRLGVENILLDMCGDESLQYNSRADAADVILQYGSSQSKKKASAVIIELGKQGRRNGNDIYNNAQNVHVKEIEESVLSALEFLQTIELEKVDGKHITFEYVEKQILDLIGQEKDLEKIQGSFNRIVLDRALYSRYNCSLSQILCKIWTYLNAHKNRDEILKRLIEELTEMSGTCSSGFASRLVNTISGFGDFNLRISWADQIVSNLTGRLNARIRDMDNLTLRDKVLAEMTLSTGNYETRKNFLKFLRKNMLSIREEMYNEFREFITDTDYDLYFRKAVSLYEMGDF